MDMAPNEKKTLERHIRSRIVAGLFVIVPLWITFLVLKMLFHVMASFLIPFIDALPLPIELDDTVLAVISVCAFIILVYLVGVISAYVVGRKFVSLGEAIIMRIPVVKSIYSAAKQVVDAFSLSNKNSFKSVVFVEFPRPGLKAIGFVTGTFADETGKRFYKVFVPHAPNPTGGFLELLTEHDMEVTDMSVEEGMKMIISGGVISPSTIRTRLMSNGI